VRERNGAPDAPRRVGKNESEKDGKEAQMQQDRKHERKHELCGHTPRPQEATELEKFRNYFMESSPRLP